MAKSTARAATAPYPIMPRYVPLPDPESPARPIPRPDPPPPLCPRCRKYHRHFHTFARCRYKALWTEGSGRWASVSFCPRGTTVIMTATRANALAFKADIDRYKCGGACVGQHHVYDLYQAGFDYSAVPA